MGRLKPNDNKPAAGAGDQDYNYDQKLPPHQPFPPPQETIFQSPHHYNLQQHPNNNVINNNNVGFGMQQQQPAAFGQPVVGVVAMSTSPSPFVNNNIINIPNQQHQPWKTGLFGCMDDPKNAITTLVCPCVTFGQVAEILDSGRTSCGSGGMLYWKIALLGMPCLISCTYRTKLRSRFGLIESPLPDCLVHCLCEHCALCQMHRELRQRGLDPSIGWAGNVAKQQQQQQQFGMTPPMQQKM